jgi:hypothetical protein
MLIVAPKSISQSVVKLSVIMLNDVESKKTCPRPGNTDLREGSVQLASTLG